MLLVYLDITYPVSAFLLALSNKLIVTQHICHVQKLLNFQYQKVTIYDGESEQKWSYSSCLMYCELPQRKKIS